MVHRLNIYDRQIVFCITNTVRKEVKKGSTVEEIEEIEEILQLGFAGDVIDLKLDNFDFTMTVAGKRIKMKY